MTSEQVAKMLLVQASQLNSASSSSASNLSVWLWGLWLVWWSGCGDFGNGGVVGGGIC